MLINWLLKIFRQTTNDMHNQKPYNIIVLGYLIPDMLMMPIVKFVQVRLIAKIKIFLSI